MSGIPSWAAVGVPVLCVGRQRKPGEPERINDKGYRETPKRGGIYTVARLVENPYYGWFLGIGGFPHDHVFHIDGFRPLDGEGREIEAEHYAKTRKNSTVKVDA